MALRSFLCDELLQRIRLFPFLCSKFHDTVSYSTVTMSSSLVSATKQPVGVAFVSEPLLPVPRNQRVRWSLNNVPRSLSGSSSCGIVKLKLEDIPRRDGVGAVKMSLEQPFTRWPLRQWSTKAWPSAYRSSVVAKSTRNMPLTPKKWKRTLPSKEVINAVYSLRRSKRNPDATKEVLKKYVSRLLKLEMMLVLSELQRLDEWHLAHQVFNMVRKESWYRPDVYLFQTMVQVFGKNRQIKLAEKMFEDLEDEGLRPDDSIKRELLRSYVICGMMPEAIQLYKEILKLGKDQAARSILFHGLSPEQKEELALYEKERGIDWSIVERRD